jgi:hypothetical protein
MTSAPPPDGFPGGRPAEAGLVAFVLAAFVVAYAGLVPTRSFGYDESDYMRAVAMGFRANYLDEPSLPLTTFLRQGVAALRGESSGRSLSELVRGSDDVTFYRHYHAPLSFYLAIATNRVAGAGERAMRWSSVLCLLLTAVAVYAAAARLGGPGARTAPPLALALYLLCPFSISAAFTVSPHALYALVSFLTLMSAAAFLADGSRAAWYGMFILLALSFLTLEYAVLLLPALAPCAARWRAFRGARPSLGLGLALFVGTILLAWPAGLFKLTLVKNYLFFAYFTLRKADAYGTGSLWEVWWGRFTGWPVGWLAILGTLPWVARQAARRGAGRPLAPFVIYAALVGLTTLRNRSPSATYVSSLMAPLGLTSGVALGHALSRVASARLRYAAAAVGLAALLTDHTVNALLPRYAVPPTTPVDQLVADLRRRPWPHHDTILLPRELLPTLTYYFPDQPFIAYDPADAAEVDRLAWGSGAKGVVIEDRASLPPGRSPSGYRYIVRGAGPSGSPPSELAR